MSREGLVTVVVGGQFGSEAKGSVVGFTAFEDAASGQAHIGVRVGGSQAGHTVYDINSVKWPLRHVPVSFVNPDAILVIAAQSQIDIGVLRSEVDALEAAGHQIRNRLRIDAQATVITDEDKQTEADRSLTARLGSTAKGVGAARSARVLRDSPLVKDRLEEFAKFLPESAIDNTSEQIMNYLALGAHVVIEGVQGYGLGLHAGHYPFCTSADARAIDFLAMAGISPWSTLVSGVRVVVVARVYPIRVAGNSGPMHEEATWEALGLPAEKTTVTQKVRRVGHWDADLIRDAVAANGGGFNSDVVLALTMVDQLYPELTDVNPIDFHSDALNFVAKCGDDAQARVALVGTGPQTLRVLDRGAWK